MALLRDWGERISQKLAREYQEECKVCQKFKNKPKPAMLEPYKRVVRVNEVVGLDF